MSSAIDLRSVAAEICRQYSLEFLGDLGQGAFKSAFLVRQSMEKVALKLSIISDDTERLEREALALMGCSHRSIATLRHAFAADAQGHLTWVVIEDFIPGGTLEKRLLERKVSSEEVRYIGLCLADVLHHLHERRLVHRDIKPANILFDDDGQTPVLTDFGVVRMLDKPSLTRDFVGLGPGTPAYAAPEQLNNEKHLIDWRTDQFGLAVVLAECLLGHHPFMEGGGDIRRAIMSVASRAHLPPTPAKTLNDLGFQALVSALSAWPISRFRTPPDFIAALSI
ncbi:serine/threonine-protein kinase [Lysobacter sp. CA199]|uniref:serine/threonine-protein kinase n=1 Tax=Lysobacter sp. CA199 TaxID=3455608 RepID=UPI003F8CF27E